jgi:hypothetical protein
VSDVNGATLELEALDVTGQLRTKLDRVSREATIGEIGRRARAQLRLPDSDPDGRQVHYRIRRDRDLHHLHDSEVAGEVLSEESRITLLPDIAAG